MNWATRNYKDVISARGRTGRAIVVAVLLAAAGGWLSRGQAAATRRPNVLMIYCDDHAYQAIRAYQPISPYGLKLNQTPNLDRLAKEGMRFDNCFVTNSI